MDIPRKMAPGEHLTSALYNALLDYVRRSTPIPGSNTTVDYTMGGARINSTSSAAVTDTSKRPWRVRYHDLDGSAQWEVYIPHGCISVGDTCKVLNRKAKDSNGHSSDDDDWYVLHVDESAGGDEDSGTREISVVVHGKRFAMRSGVDSIDDSAGPGVYVSADRTGDGVKSGCGDVFRQIVATIKLDGSGREINRGVTRTVDSAISVGTIAQEPFDLVWWFSVGTDGALSVDHVYCIRQTASLAGGDLSIDQDAMTDVKGAQSVYLWIVTQGGANVGSVVCDPSSSTGNDTQTWIRLYSMDNDSVTNDSRKSNLSNIQYYR